MSSTVWDFRHTQRHRGRATGDDPSQRRSSRTGREVGNAHREINKRQTGSTGTLNMTTVTLNVKDDLLIVGSK